MTGRTEVASSTPPGTGSKRFVRPDRLPEFKLTPRVLALLAYTAKHRLISSDDLARLDGGSGQNVKRELRNLWANRYLLRPAVQLNTVAITGPQPLVYGSQIAARGFCVTMATSSTPMSTGRKTADALAWHSSIIRLRARASWRRST